MGASNLTMLQSVPLQTVLFRLDPSPFSYCGSLLTKVSLANHSRGLMWYKVSGLPKAIYHCIICGHAISEDECVAPCKVLRANLVLVGDIANPADHSPVIALQMMQVR